jgi:hypothetical protein
MPPQGKQVCKGVFPFAAKVVDRGKKWANKKSCLLAALLNKFLN